MTSLPYGPVFWLSNMTWCKYASFIPTKLHKSLIRWWDKRKAKSKAFGEEYIYFWAIECILWGTTFYFAKLSKPLER
jgi:hypothetical protein